MRVRVAPVVAVVVGLLAGPAFAQDEGDPEGEPTEASGDDGSGDGAATDPADRPTNLRLRQLEQNVQSLKERAWRSKARVGMLKEAVLGGGVGARATLVHRNKMGRAFRLEKVIYAVDGTQVFTRSDEGSGLHDQKSIEILSGPIAPGNHTISVMFVFRGSGFGPFKYLKKYKYTVKSSHTFTASEGKHTRIEIVAFEKGSWNTPLRDRPGVDYRVTTSEGGPK
jgi:hypothetical protein